MFDPTITEALKAAGRAGQRTDPAILKQKLLAAYAVIQARYARGELKLVDLVDQLYDSLPPLDKIGTECRQAARIVAQNLDANADGTHKNRYHNPAHFGEVLLNAFVLAYYNNATEQYTLRGYEIAQLGLASIAHDVGHDGTGNKVDGQHVPFRLEQQSIAIVTAWLKAAQNVTKLSRSVALALNLIHATDVSGDAAWSPARQVRIGYDNRKRMHSVRIPAEMKSILISPRQTLLAAMLTDADVLSSTIDADKYISESDKLAKERDPQARFTFASGPYFLRVILAERMTTVAARRLADDNIKAMLRQHNGTPSGPEPGGAF